MCAVVNCAFNAYTFAVVDFMDKDKNEHEKLHANKLNCTKWSKYEWNNRSSETN